MIFDKSRKPGGNDKVFFVDASREFEQGTNQNVLRAEDIEKIVSTFHKRKVIDKYSYNATFKEIEENDFNLNIPRYVDTFEEEEPIDIDAVQAEIDELEKELVEVRKEMSAKLVQLKMDNA